LRHVLYIKAFNAKGPDATIEDLFSTYKRTNSDGATVLRRDDIMRAIDHTGPWFDDLLRAYAPPQPPGAAHGAPEEICFDCLVNFVLTGSVLPASRCTDSTRTSTRRPTACFGAFERRLDELGGDISLGEADAALRAAEHSLRVDDVELGPREALRAPDHSALHGEKRFQHLTGTRLWVFDEFDAWLTSLTADKLFWLMGSGGTGARPARPVLSVVIRGDSRQERHLRCTARPAARARPGHRVALPPPRRRGVVEDRDDHPVLRRHVLQDGARLRGAAPRRPAHIFR
jgi:hypothetical protein